MKVAVRYYTRSGNTEKLAKGIAEAIGVTASNMVVPLGEKADIISKAQEFAKRMLSQ